MSAPTDRMTPRERRARRFLLASIFALRMLGLFLILPVFSVCAKTFACLTTTLARMVGFVVLLGAYTALTSFLPGIPYGIASDYFGRKRVIVIPACSSSLGNFVARLGPGHDAD